jgi:hypothetical protein
MKIKLILTLFSFLLSGYSFTYLCTPETETGEGQEPFYLVKYDGKYKCMVIKTNKLKNEYDPWNKDHDYPEFDPEYDPEHEENLELIVEETEETLLLMTPFIKRSYRVTILDKVEKIWMCGVLSPYKNIKDTIQEFEPNITELKTCGTFEIIEETSNKDDISP